MIYIKSYSHLYEQLFDKQYIIKCIGKAFINKKRNKTEDYMFKNRAAAADKIIELLRKDKVLQPHQRKSKKVFEPNSQKYRTLIKPEPIEHVLQHAICGLLFPNKIEKSFYKYTVAAIPKRGDEFGKKAVKKWIHKYEDKDFYVFKFDIYHFFENVNRKILFLQLARIIKDEKFLKLIKRIIWYDGDEKGRGIPIGFYSSQWFSNLYLKDFDYFIKQKLGIQRLIRYMDDVVLFDENKEKLQQSIYFIQSYLQQLDLKIKSNYQIFQFEKFGKGRFLDFMDFKFYRDKITLRKRTLKRIRTKMNRLMKKKRLHLPFSYLDACQANSYFSRLKRANVFLYYKKFIFLNEKVFIQIIRKHDLNEVI